MLLPEITPTMLTQLYSAESYERFARTAEGIQEGLTAELQRINEARALRIRYLRDQNHTDAWSTVPACADYLASNRAHGEALFLGSGLIENEVLVSPRAYEMPDEIEATTLGQDYNLYFALVGSVPVATSVQHPSPKQMVRNRSLIVEVHPALFNVSRPIDVLRLLALPLLPTTAYQLRSGVFQRIVEEQIQSPKGTYFIKERKRNESGIRVWAADIPWCGMRLAQDDTGIWQATRYSLDV